MSICVRRTTFVLLGVVLALLTVPTTLRAANVQVICPGGGPGAYPSISAALAAIGQTGPSTISVTGTCNENVTLNNARSLTIFAGPGGAKIVGPQDNDSVDIFRSQDINLQNLEIAGTPGTTVDTAGGGVLISDASEVHIVGCNIHDNQGGGVFTQTGSRLFLSYTTIQNNSPGDALNVVNDSSADMVGTTIQNNGFGVFVQNRSGVIFRGKNLILNNDIGIQATDVSSVRLQTPDPSLFTTVQGHNTSGIVVARQSALVIAGAPHLVQNNGSACPGDPLCGGVVALRNSTVRLFAGNITGNQGSGISVQQGANVVLSGATISNNSGNGVQIQRISIGDFMAGNTIAGNGGASVFCDERSLVVGNLTGISNVKCDQIDQPGQLRHAEQDRDKERK